MCVVVGGGGGLTMEQPWFCSFCFGLGETERTGHKQSKCWSHFHKDSGTGSLLLLLPNESNPDTAVPRTHTWVLTPLPRVGAKPLAEDNIFCGLGTNLFIAELFGLQGIGETISPKVTPPAKACVREASFPGSNSNSKKHYVYIFR